MTATPARRTRHIPGFDGIRGIAVLFVLAFHSTRDHVLPGGFLGVDVFFVLSGFLITQQLLGPINLRVFLGRRLARLWPALLTTLVVVFAVTMIARRTVPINGAYSAVYAINELYAHRAATRGSLYVSHTWSLGIEAQFYLAWAVALVYFRKRGTSVRRLLWVTVTVTLVSFGLRAVYLLVHDDSMLAYFSTESRLDALFLGASLAVIASVDEERLQKFALPGPAILLLVGSVIIFRFGTPAAILAGIPLAAISAGLLVSASLTRPDRPLVRVLASRPLVALGLRSYSLYLWHFPVFLLVQDNTSLTGMWLVVVEWPLAMLVAEASYRLVEGPARRALYSRIGNTGAFLGPTPGGGASR